MNLEAKKSFPVFATISSIPVLLGLIWFALIMSELILGPPEGVEDEGAPFVYIFWLAVQFLLSITATLLLNRSSSRKENYKKLRIALLSFGWLPIFVFVLLFLVAVAI
ncbi:MAG: hypothetical protein AB1724_11065 [Thermodesulfobacteriota bacterium]